MREKSVPRGTDFRIQEDLTPTIYKRLKDLRKSEKVEKCWSVDGKIKYKLKNDPRVKMISNQKELENVIHY